MNQINIARAIISKRKEKGVTQEELATHIGVSIAAVSKWETTKAIHLYVQAHAKKYF